MKLNQEIKSAAREVFNLLKLCTVLSSLGIGGYCFASQEQPKTPDFEKFLKSCARAHGGKVYSHYGFKEHMRLVTTYACLTKDGRMLRHTPGALPHSRTETIDIIRDAVGQGYSAGDVCDIEVNSETGAVTCVSPKAFMPMRNDY